MSASLLLRAAIVGLGGFVGSALRFLVGGWVHRALPGTSFPVGTFTVNLVGCLVIGLLGGLIDLRQALGPNGRLFLMIGLLGGFTTFSSFSYETFALAQDAEWLRAAANVGLQVVLGLGAAWAGYTAVRMLYGG
jgi:CrcB protein